MKITAITKFKHGALWNAIKEAGWSQSELARRIGVSAQTIGHIFNLQTRPSVEQANKIQRVLAEVGHFIDVLEEWPETFEGFSKPIRIEQTEDVAPESLPMCKEALQIPEESDLELEHRLSLLDAAIEDLPDREKEVLQARFWQGETLESIGRRRGVGMERIRQIQSKALRGLRRDLALDKTNPIPPVDWDQLGNCEKRVPKYKLLADQRWSETLDRREAE